MSLQDQVSQPQQMLQAKHRLIFGAYSIVLQERKMPTATIIIHTGNPTWKVLGILLSIALSTSWGLLVAPITMTWHDGSVIRPVQQNASIFQKLTGYITQSKTLVRVINETLEINFELETMWCHIVILTIYHKSIWSCCDCTTTHKSAHTSPLILCHNGWLWSRLSPDTNHSWPMWYKFIHWCTIMIHMTINYCLEVNQDQVFSNNLRNGYPWGMFFQTFRYLFIKW